jgi:acyl-coenzyme A thioesterase 9
VARRVIAEVLNPLDKTKDKTNSFYFTFTCPEGGQQLPAVIPDTYEEAIQYLEGKRRYDEGKHTAETLGSQLLRFY